MAKMTFEDRRDVFADDSVHKMASGDGWSIFCGYDVRGYAVFVQRAVDEKKIMVRAGCRYLTLRDAMNHWGHRHKRPHGKVILQLIENGLRMAVRAGWLKARYYPQWFDTKLRR